MWHLATVFVALATIYPCAVARLHGAPTAGDVGHQLAADKGAVSANPEVDAWHEQEKARIEAECDEMMRQLILQKRQKLQDIVDEAARRVEEERRRLAELEAAAAKELDDLEKEKDELKKVEVPTVGPTKDLVSDQEAKIKALEEEIGKKKACLEELHEAEKDLLEAERKLAEAIKKMDEAKAAKAKQEGIAERESGDIPPAEKDLESAEEDLARAKARHAAAEKIFKKARVDLAEHDNEGLAEKGSSGSSSPAPSPAPEKPEAPKAKSGSRRAVAAGAALFITALLSV